MMTTSSANPSRMPVLFIGHGSPMVALDTTDAFNLALSAYSAGMTKPQAIVVVSAHWETRGSVEISSGPRPHQVYDFRGFPSELYLFEYPARGQPELAFRIGLLLTAARVVSSMNETHGFDHGVWVPLCVAFPKADIPVIQISVPMDRPETLLEVGKALAPLRDEGVLLVGSGNLVHNLQKLRWEQKRGDAYPWAENFASWAKERIAQGGQADIDSLIRFESNAPNLEEAKLAHPTPEHLWPLLFVLGARRSDDEIRVIYDAFDHRSISMHTFALESRER